MLGQTDDTFAYAVNGDKSFSFPFRIHTAPASESLPIMAWGEDVPSVPLQSGGNADRQPVHHAYPSPYPEHVLARAESDHQFRPLPMHSAKSAFKSVIQNNNGGISSSNNSSSGNASLPKYLRKELSREEDVPTAIPVAGPVPPPPPPRTTLPLPQYASHSLDLPSPDLPPPPPELLFSPDQHSKPFEVAASRPTTLNLSEVPLKSHSNHKVLTRAQSNPLSIVNSAAAAASSDVLPSPPAAFAVDTSPYLYPYAPIPAPVTVVMDNSATSRQQNGVHKIHQRTSSLGDSDGAVSAAAKSLANIMVTSKPPKPDAAVPARKSSLTEAAAAAGIITHKPPKHPSVTSSVVEPGFSSSSASRNNNTATGGVIRQEDNSGSNKRPPLIPSKPTRSSIISYQQITCAQQLAASDQQRCTDEDLAMASYAGIHANSPIFQDARFTVSSVRF